MARRREIDAEKLAEQLKCDVIDGPPEPFGEDNPRSRAVARFVLQSSSDYCVECNERAGFKAQNTKQIKILATVVDKDGNWQETKCYFPPECYDKAGAPYGPVYTMSPQEGIEAGLIESRAEKVVTQGS
ncbi:hypothetical protein KC950_00370 [Candidatus Saccharibacteria bacterium]|nr:hypothetical protein [Candidatus Saccharibacteria bacterium]